MEDLFPDKLKKSKFRAKYKDVGRRFMGADKVLRQNPYSSPDTFEPRRRLSPTLACRDKWRRIEELQIQKGFKRDHRRCMEQWMAGDRDVVFPLGTYKMRVLHRVRVAEG